MKIGNKQHIGTGYPCFIVAEGGLSHGGHFSGAQDLVRIAKTAGADAIKFQIYRTEEFINKKTLPAWFERYKSCELSYEQWAKIKEYADNLGIIFFASAHDNKSFDFLCELGVPLFKIGSGELGNWEYIKKIASTGKPVLVSTGMYHRNSIKKVVDVFKATENPDLVLMHCVTAYPTKPEEANMSRMVHIREDFGVEVGYSDHTLGIMFPSMAVAMGAVAVEKHISCDYTDTTRQDYAVSASPLDLKQMVDSIRTFESGLGKGINAAISETERKNKAWATKKLVEGRMIRA